jgi:hypothetical protein
LWQFTVRQEKMEWHQSTVRHCWQSRQLGNAAGSEVERDGSDGCAEVAVDAAVVRLRPVGVDAARGHVNVLQHVGAFSHRHLEVYQRLFNLLFFVCDAPDQEHLAHAITLRVT